MDRIEAVAEYMRAHGLTLVTAESCTAGLISARLADVPGTGALLDCAFVVYSPEAKQRCVGVSAQTLEHHNLTSEAVAREMVLGAVCRSPANAAISNTGVVDDTDDKIPSGTQCFAWAFKVDQGPPRVFTETRRFQGDRHAIRKAAAEYALTRLADHHGTLKTGTSSS